MSEQIMLRCQDSMEGIFSAIYQAFVLKNQFAEEYTDSIKIAVGPDQPFDFFYREIEVETDSDRAAKTIKAIISKMGQQVYYEVVCALCHFDEDRATTVLGFLVRGFKMGPRILEALADPYVMRTFELSRKVNNEICKLKGFLRFQDTGDYLFGEIEPKCNVIPIMWEHFADRYPNEHFIIYDNKRKFSYVHKAYGDGVFVYDQDLHDRINLDGDYFTVLWRRYFDTMAIQARENENCQNNLAPKWYRKNMPEFS